METPLIDTGIISVRALFIIIPFIIALFHCVWKKNAAGFCKCECFLVYFLVIAVGLQGVLLGHLEVFHSEIVAAYIGFPDSPFLIQVGKAHFTFGILGILCFWLKGGWREATGVGNALFFFLLSIGHMQTLRTSSGAPETLQLVMISDLILAVILTVLLALHYFRKMAS